MSFNSEMKGLADAIREKAGITTPLSISKMTSAVNNIEIGGGGGDIPHEVLVANDERIRWFNIDASEKIDNIQDPTYSGNLLVMNGKLFRIFGPADQKNWDAACEPICERTDLKAVYYYWDNNYILLTDGGEVYHCRYARDTSVTPTFPILVRFITSGANDIVPTEDRVFYIKKGTNVELWEHGNDGNFYLKATATGISKFLMKRTNTNYSDEGLAHGVFCRDTSGNMVALYSLIPQWEDQESYLRTKIVNGPPADGDAWEEINFEQYYHEEHEGTGVKILFATTSNGALYYTSAANHDINDYTSNLNLTRCNDINKVKCCPLAAESYAGYYWNEETGEEGYKAYASKVAIAVDDAGNLYKIKANLRIDGWSSTFTGLVVTQVFPELAGKCKWCFGNINKNDRCIAQSSKNIILITSDESEDINLQYKTGAYIETTIKYAWSPADGDWCVLAYNE